MEHSAFLGHWDHPHDINGELRHYTFVKTHGVCGTTSDPHVNLGLSSVIVCQS